MDRRAFFKTLLGKGLSHGARQVDAIVIPFERAARAARQTLPEEPPSLVPVADLDGAAEADPLAVRRPQPVQPVTTPCALEDLMRLAADAGLIRHVEAVCALARRAVRLVPGAPGEAAGRSRFGGAPDLPDEIAWPTWDEEPLAFLCQIDLAEATAAGIDEVLPPDGVLLVFAAAERTPSGSSPIDCGSTRAIYVPPEHVPVASPAPAGPTVPEAPRAMRISSELTIPRVWDRVVRALNLDADEQRAWEEVRSELAALQGVESWEPGGELHARHFLLGYADETRGDMGLTCELVARGVDVGYASATTHPDARDAQDVAERWRLLLQLTIDDELGWRFGAERERLFLWAPEDELREGRTAQVHGIAR